MTVRKTSVLVLDCAEPETLADFYARLLGARAERGADPDFIDVIAEEGVRLSVRRDHGYAPPSWPRPDDSQQAHLHILVDGEDMDEAEREAIGLGATPVEAKVSAGVRDVRTYADPAGHSFTLTARLG
ncbi:VOC family protein [Streptomyces sp. SP18CS02]|uniref:VOC family protein n=1 Tax=Streptomyces sp. SP18CS02 TaxID=3002531 RepID=UPI002E767D9A|nr:VOC family protein [Streptomyces sp. SP18CS02]MEE1751586.1 VOC family protein [Streptomyces sp. SP18CS02]